MFTVIEEIPWKHNSPPNCSTKTVGHMNANGPNSLNEGNVHLILKILNISLFVNNITDSSAVKLGHAQALLNAIARVCMKTFSLAGEMYLF